MNGIMISVYNLKGGVGKSATVVNLSHALAREGKKVLAIDVDPQCNTTSTLLGKEYNHNVESEYCIYKLLKPNGDNSQPNDIEKFIYTTDYKGLFLLPNIKKSLALEPQILLNAPKSFSNLRDRIREYIKKNFDFALIDNHPALGVFTIISLTACDWAIIPNEAGSKYNIDGLIEAINLYTDIKKENSNLSLLKILITKVDGRIKSHAATIEHIRNALSEENIFKTSIPSNADVQNAELAGMSVFSYRSNAPSAKAYTDLSKEIITIAHGE